MYFCNIIKRSHSYYIFKSLTHKTPLKVCFRLLCLIAFKFHKSFSVWPIHMRQFISNEILIILNIYNIKYE